MAGTSGEDTSSLAPSLPDSVTMLSTPAGNDGQAASSSANLPLVSAVCAAIFTTAVHPAASAGANDRTARTTGEFQGTITPATPIGSRTSVDSTPAVAWSPRPLPVNACAA